MGGGAATRSSSLATNWLQLRSRRCCARVPWSCGCVQGRGGVKEKEMVARHGVKPKVMPGRLAPCQKLRWSHFLPELPCLLVLLAPNHSWLEISCVSASFASSELFHLVADSRGDPDLVTRLRCGQSTGPAASCFFNHFSSRHQIIN